MNQIFDKLGIYDLVAVLLSGVCITSFSVLLEEAFFQSNILAFLKDETFLFWLMSYFIGVVFQEITSLIYKQIIEKESRLLSEVLNTEMDKTNQALTRKEKEELERIVKDALNLKTIPNAKMLYNYCRFYAIDKGNMARADKDQSMSGMSRNLALYFGIASLFMIVSSFFKQCVLHFCCGLGMFALAVLLYYRSVRFIKMRYIYILRSCYYGISQNQAQKGKKQK